jgi:hypothetical protein
MQPEERPVPQDLLQEILEAHRRIEAMRRQVGEAEFQRRLAEGLQAFDRRIQEEMERWHPLPGPVVQPRRKTPEPGEVGGIAVPGLVPILALRRRVPEESGRSWTTSWEDEKARFHLELTFIPQGPKRYAIQGRVTLPSDVRPVGLELALKVEEESGKKKGRRVARRKEWVAPLEPAQGQATVDFSGRGTLPVSGVKLLPVLRNPQTGEEWPLRHMGSLGPERVEENIGGSGVNAREEDRHRNGSRPTCLIASASDKACGGYTEVGNLTQRGSITKSCWQPQPLNALLPLATFISNAYYDEQENSQTRVEQPAPSVPYATAPLLKAAMSHP